MRAWDSFSVSLSLFSVKVDFQIEARKGQQRDPTKRKERKKKHLEVRLLRKKNKSNFKLPSKGGIDWQ